MANLATNRIKRELKQKISDAERENSGVDFHTSGDSLFHLTGRIVGPPDSPYEGGRFVVDIVLTEDYPRNPPSIKFVTPVWHPNVSSLTGAICLNVLKVDWLPSMCISNSLIAVRSLLTCPEPSNPQDATVGHQFIHEQTIFRKTAIFWTQFFANGPGEMDADFKENLTTITSKGYGNEEAIRALSNCSWHVPHAEQFLA